MKESGSLLNQKTVYNKKLKHQYALFRPTVFSKTVGLHYDKQQTNDKIL